MAGDVLQKFKSSVNRGITTISVKTSSTLEKSKIKTHIETLSRDIKNDIALVGDAAYKIWLSGKTDFSELFEKFEAIKNKYQDVEDLNKQLSSIDERDSQILGNNVAEQKEIKKTYICTNCGTQYEVPVNFCRKCGKKIEE